MKGLLFTLAMTYGGAAAALFRPFTGFLVYTCFAVLRPESLWHWALRGGNYSRTVAIAMLVGWLLQGVGSWRFFRANAVVMALIGYATWSVVCAGLAPHQTIAWRYIDNLSKILLPFLVGITMLDSVRQLKQLAWVIILSQGYVAFELNLAYLGGFNRVQRYGFGGMDNNSIAIAFVTCVGLAFFMGLQARSRLQQLAALGSALLITHAVLLTFSRGGMVALLLTATVAFLLVPKEPKHYVIFLAVLLIGLRMAGPQVVERFSTVFADSEERDGSAASRLDLWAACWDSMLKNPVVGLGPDHWPLKAPSYGFPPNKEAHSTWMQVGAELGFPGLLCLMSFYALCMSRLRPLLNPSIPVPDPWLRDVARMVIASLVGFVVAAQFVTLEGLEVPYYVVLLGAGALKLWSIGAEQGAPQDIQPHGGFVGPSGQPAL